MMVPPAIPCCSGEPPARRRRRTSAREQKRNKPRPTGPHWTNQTHRYRAQNAPARAQQHCSELWSPVRDEEAAGSNPVTPTSVSAGERPAPELVRASFAASTAAKYGKYSNESENWPAHRRGSPQPALRFAGRHRAGVRVDLQRHRHVYVTPDPHDHPRVDFQIRQQRCASPSCIVNGASRRNSVVRK